MDDIDLYRDRLKRADELLIDIHAMLAHLADPASHPPPEPSFLEETLASVRRHLSDRRASPLVEILQKHEMRLGQHDRALASKMITTTTRDTFALRYHGHDFKQCLNAFHHWALRVKEFSAPTIDEANAVFNDFARRWVKEQQTAPPAEAPLEKPRRRPRQK